MQNANCAQTGALKVGPYQGSVNPPRTPTSELLPDRKIEVPETPDRAAAKANDERDKVEELSLEEKFFRSILTSKQLETLDVPERPPTVADWFQDEDIGFIFANRGTGKTWFAMEMAKSIATGENFGHWPVHNPQKVLYIDGEVALRDTKKRNFRLSIKSENFHYLHHEWMYQEQQETMDLAKPEQQSVFLSLCRRMEVKIVILDNLSCLAPTVDENDSFGFSNELLNFTLNMRRNGISLVFIQHAGRSGQMRGHSRREDAANWIIKLDDAKDADEDAGAKFRSIFVKNRNAERTPTSYQWHFNPTGDKTIVTVKEMDPLALLRHNIEMGINTNKELAEAMGEQAYTITRLTQKAEKQGWLRKGKGKNSPYEIVTAKPAEGIKVPAKPKDEAPEWIYEEGDSLCVVTDLPEDMVHVECTATGQFREGRNPGPSKHADATLAWAIDQLNKSCDYGSHYLERV
jgi:AAA domain